MAYFIDKTGNRYGRLVVLAGAPTLKIGRTRWLCRCECGNEVIVTGSDLTVGRTQSCGCLQAERTAQTNAERIRHGHSRSGGGNKRNTTPEYRSWKAMLERCRNPNIPNYHLYGGRGITVCDRWQGETGFINFLADMGKRPDGKTLDRENVNGNYEPSNCRWSDAKTQSNNRRETPEYAASRKASLDRGRKRMWSDPEIRARLLESRRKKR